jgi:hypothetical protein
MSLRNTETGAVLEQMVLHSLNTLAVVQGEANISLMSLLIVAIAIF